MKKKKNSIHLRRIRQRSTNKSIKYRIIKFFDLFKKVFIKKIKVKKSFCSFLLCFKGLSIFKIFFMYKIFGLNKNFVYLNNKNSNINAFFLVFKRKYTLMQYADHYRYINVEKKKKLFFHVSYRHFLKLPVRGQRTRTNAKTRKHYVII